MLKRVEQDEPEDPPRQTLHLRGATAARDMGNTVLQVDRPREPGDQGQVLKVLPVALIKMIFYWLKMLLIPPAGDIDANTRYILSNVCKQSKKCNLRILPRNPDQYFFAYTKLTSISL